MLNRSSKTTDGPRTHRGASGPGDPRRCCIVRDGCGRPEAMLHSQGWLWETQSDAAAQSGVAVGELATFILCSYFKIYFVASVRVSRFTTYKLASRDTYYFMMSLQWFPDRNKLIHTSLVGMHRLARTAPMH